MTDNGENCLLQFTWAQGDVFEGCVLTDQHKY